MRQRSWLPAVLVVVLLLPASGADAFWQYIRELSGPGPFVGLSLLFPFSLSKPPTLTRELNNENVANLKRLGVDTEFLASTAEEFVANREHQRLLKKEFGVYLPDRQHCLQASEDATRIATCRFLKATQVDPTYPSKLSELLAPLPAEKRQKFESQPPDDDRERVATANERLAILEEMLMLIKTQELAERIRDYDADMGGLLGGFRMIPELKDRCGKNQINNWFITPSVGAEYALHNNIPYADGSPGDRDVLWLSAYLALEKRFLALGGGRSNLFFQVGPAGHYFTGLQFEDFWKASARGRVGVQIKRVYVGLQTDYFFTPIKNEQFGALPDPEPERWSFGFFFGISLNGKGR